jgi:PAS domain S-box-containing protein
LPRPCGCAIIRKRERRPIEPARGATFRLIGCMQQQPGNLASPARLAALEASTLLDAGSLPALDRVVRLAALVLDVPVAQLNAVTATQQIPISHVGDAVWGRAVGLDRSLCHHVIATGEPLAVPDAREHALLRSEPGAAGRGMAAYVSVPIRAPAAGEPIATLCAIAFEPRAWSDRDVGVLRELAAWAESEIELRIAQIRTRLEEEEALRSAQARLRLALDAAELGDWELDLRTQESPRRSLRHDRIFGYAEPVHDWSYERFVEHAHPDDRAEVDRRFRVAIEKGEPWDFECRIHRVDGELRWIWARGGIHHDSAGRPSRALGVVMDITERKHAEAEREKLLAAERAARAEAEAANRSKSQFLAVMSHELRTPLNAISGYADLLELGIHGPTTEAQRKALGRIQASQQHLLGLINEVLNYAKLESGSVQYDIDDVRVGEALAGVRSLVEPQARARNLELVIADCAPDVAARADPEKLRQILLNLVGNAIKFTSAGGRIEVTCDTRGSHVHIAVRDTGIGIEADKLEAVFEPFVQVHSDLTRKSDGTGLGLAISRDLALDMNGDLTVESEPGSGSTFTLRLPAARAPVDAG